MSSSRPWQTCRLWPAPALPSQPILHSPGDPDKLCSGGRGSPESMLFMKTPFHNSNDCCKLKTFKFHAPPFVKLIFLVRKIPVSVPVLGLRAPVFIQHGNRNQMHVKTLPKRVLSPMSLLLLQ